jgi:sirohydrochlorin cobaltochelatase
MQDARTGILFAVPGTSCPEAAVAFENIRRATAARFPGLITRWAYTSAGIRRKVAAQGCHLEAPREALQALRNEGITRAVVLSLHLSDGMEYNELKDEVTEALHGGTGWERLALGQPLLASPADLRRAAEAILAETAAAGRGEAAVILVAHGSRQAQDTFRSAATLFRQIDRRLFLGSILCPPLLDKVLGDCLQAGIRKAWLLPCMVAAGFSARDEIAGSGENTWATLLTRGGVECVPVIKGLGEFDGVVDVWMDQVARLLPKCAT